MSNHDHKEMEKHFDRVLNSVDSVQLNFTTEFYDALEKYAEHYAAQHQPDEIAAKDLRIKKLEYAAKAVVRRGLIHNYMSDDELEAVIVDLQNVLESGQ